MPALHQNSLVDAPTLVTTLPPNQLQNEENSKYIRRTSQVDQPSMEASPASISHDDMQRKSTIKRERTMASTPKSVNITSTPKKESTTSRKRTRPAVNHANIASRRLYKIWFKLTLPVVVVSFALTRSITVLFLATIFPITIAMMQGFARMINYRLRYAKAPVPRAPSHGVVKCTSLKRDSQTPSPMAAISEDEMETPLRLLLIGDSLAVGVGQSSSCTPIMPDVIAKELSKELGGRPVMWTCHGTPGASTGWIIRELEKFMKSGVFQLLSSPDKKKKFQHYSTMDSDDSDHPTTEMLNCCPTASDDSSCDSTDSPLYHLDEDLQAWQRRLKQQRIDFDPQSLAPFDIAVVLTGSNDLKNACFPFLKKEEDSDGVSTQASDYGKELQRLLKTLNCRMRRQIQTIQQSVRVAKEKVQETVDTVVVRTLGRGSSLRNINSDTQLVDNPDEEVDLYSVSCTTSENGDSTAKTNETTRLLRMEEAAESNHQSFFPMVVLPGMPANALPAFDAFPLRHLAHPMVEIMDGHKRNISNAHDGEVLFVNPPSKKALSEFSEKKGIYWSQGVDDNVLLSACDISQRKKEAMEDDMKEYYEEYQTTFECNPPKAYKYFSAFSADGIHPNDNGYNFWGRYIGNAIVMEWRRKQGIETIQVV